jgi:hypothetical protein
MGDSSEVSRLQLRNPVIFDSTTPTASYTLTAPRDGNGAFLAAIRRAQ